MQMAEMIRSAGGPTVHPYAGLFRRILACYGLEYSAPICFGLGCELDFVLPSPGELARPRQAGFHRGRFYPELSHAVGIWFREVRSHTGNTFAHYLDLEWEDFAGKMQPLPIFTHLQGEDGGLLRPVLMIDFDKSSGRYTFLSGLTDQVIELSRAELTAMELPVYGHAIFHPPLNFLKHGSKFRPLRSSLRFALQRTIHQLTVGYGETGLEAIERLCAGLSAGGFTEPYLTELARYYLEISRGDLAENGLYRRCFAEFMEEVFTLTTVTSFGQAERVYRELASMWSDFLRLCQGAVAGEIGIDGFRVRGAGRLAVIKEEERRAVSLLEAGLAAMAEGGVA